MKQIRDDEELRKEFNVLTSAYDGDDEYKARCLMSGYEPKCVICGTETSWSTNQHWNRYCREHDTQHIATWPETRRIVITASKLLGSMSEIVDETGQSIYLVKKILKENGIKLPLKPAEDYSEHRKLYLSGLTISEVSLRLGCTKNIVRKAIEGLPRHSQSDAIKSFIQRNPRTPKPYVCPFEHLEETFVEEYKLGKPTSKIAEDYGCSTHIVLKYLKKNNIDCKRFTQPERAISYILNKHGIEHEVHNRLIIKPKELDIWIPPNNIAIEVNGLFWHSSIKESNRHKHKFLMCQDKGITLLQFTDYDIRTRFDMVESIILQTLEMTPITIDVNDCAIVEIDNSKDFFNSNYYGNYDYSETAGLVYNNEIVMAMSFSNNSIVFASKLFHNIEGGFEKLEQYFIDKYNPTFILSNSIALVDNGQTLIYNGYAINRISSPEKYITNGWRIGVGKRIYSGAGIIEYRKEIKHEKTRKAKR